MLGELEDKVMARLGTLRKTLPRLSLDSYGGELADPDLIPNLLRNCPAVLITTPKAQFVRRTQRRYGLEVTFRLIIACRHPRGERQTRRGSGRHEESRRGTTVDPGSYALWDACVRSLTDFQPWEDRPGCRPTEFANLVNGRFQSDHLSVLGQSFALDALWEIPEDVDAPLLEGIGMKYYSPPDAELPVLTDHIHLGAGDKPDDKET